jgi:two-component system NtrC family sensor kinase
MIENKELTREFLKALRDKYTYDPRVNDSARWALLWCTILLLLGSIHLLSQSNFLITAVIDVLFGVIAVALYPTLGTTGTLYKDREETIAAYSKNLEKLVEQKVEELRKEEKKYQTLFEIVPDGLFRVTGALEIADINVYALNLLGLPNEQVIGQRCLDIICKGKGPCKLSGLAGETATQEIALHYPDGTRNYVVISCRNWEMEGKASIIGSITDISERKKLEETILENQQRLKSIFDGMDDGIFVLDQKQKIAAINRKLATVIGVLPEQVIGKHCSEVITSVCREVSQNVFQTGTKDRREIVLSHENDQEMYVDIIYAPIKNTDGRVEQVIGVLRDITEKRQMEKFLLRAERLATMGELAASIAHEINNPIGIILGFTQRLLARTSENSMDHEELGIIEHECIRCRKIISDLLDFARPSIPQKCLLQGEEVKETINNCLKLFDYECNKRGTCVKRNLDRRAMIKIDPHQFQQVLMNIILNAVQAMPKGGELQVSVPPPIYHSRYPDGLSLITIEDTGTGISPADLIHVFEPFYST